MASPDQLKDFLRTATNIVRVKVTNVRGSAPREAEATMLVSASDVFGTIGGGRLEFDAIHSAQQVLQSGRGGYRRLVSLGPEIGQCCGGQVELEFEPLAELDFESLVAEAEQTFQQRPSVFVFGSGHVGRELANLLQHLPVRTVLVDQRASELERSSANVEKRISALPEAEIKNAAASSVFVILTHDHGLDFLLTSAALARSDAAYVGLIGSKTKRAKFKSWCATHCEGLSLDTLVCPIGASCSHDKRPAVIASFVATEIMGSLMPPS